MEEIRNAAQIYYETAPKDVKRLARDLFQKMDSNDDEKVSLDEFARFMTEGGYVAMNNPTFFKKINKNKNRKLDFDDVKTLCYILVSRRPLCDGCREFIEGMYFTCVKCFTRAQSFCLHPDCFRKKKYDHKLTHSHFLDNYALLESIRRNELPAQNNESLQRNQSTPSTLISSAIVLPSLQRNQSTPSTRIPSAIVLPPLQRNQSTPSTRISPAIVLPPLLKPNQSTPSTPISSAIVPTPSKRNQSTPSTSTSSAIVPRPRDKRPQKSPLELAFGMAANIAVITAALAQCTIM